MNDKPDAVVVNGFSFSYSNKYGPEIPALYDINLRLEDGACCLVIGANGAGKSTLLRTLAGKHMHEKDQVVVLGLPAFYQTLGLSGINFLGGGWTKTIAFAGNNIPVQGDIMVKNMCKNLQDEFPERRDKLYEILEIEPEWRMHQVSDGQRRRVQIMLGLLRPFKLLLLDEMTVDLDICARADFLGFLKSEAAERGATVVYCTHIFDGLDEFPSHLLLLEEGKMVRCERFSELTKEPGFESLYSFVKSFLRRAQERRRERKLEVRSKPDPEKSHWKGFGNDGYSSGRLGSFSVEDFMK